ncbi:uncharacterized protein LOC110098350 [Dendrobium catenatum]|uniref:uncharacterized protein LOC110098350 n=1 Tax=Dendrobium catenatum TaxID=906689 RepID=UPI0009F47845|nr:uncharacterized protein LOC110098350 [Dendrobium catenatum]
MSSEFEALQQQGTWTLVPTSPHYNILGCKWIYRTKRNADGSLARYKARLVAQGFNQEYGLDYFDTFSPVAKFPTIRILFTIAVTSNWPILQLDISNAFLHDKLDETIYMMQPLGLPDNVSLADPSLLRFSKDAIQLYLLVYVDDILLTGNSAQALDSLLHALHSRFQMRNLGQASNFLGIQVVPIANGLHLSQSMYATQLLQKAGMQDSKPVLTLLPVKLPTVNSSDSLFEQPELYKQLVGSLQYLTITRPDLSFSVNLLCQQMHQPYLFHYQLLKRVLRYIAGTIQLGLPITSSSLDLQAYSDSDWAADSTTRRSITGYCAFLGNTLVSWCVKKQTTVARSSTEAEDRALATAATDIVWLRRLLQDFSIPPTTPTSLFCDNVSALALAQNPVFHARTKHIEVDFHFIRDYIRQKQISVHHIASIDQPADLFTKAFSATSFNSCATS